MVYDELAGQWLLSFVSGSNLCVYVSATGVPTSDPGDWYFYPFTISGSLDYRKIVVWPDAYYVSVNDNSTLGAVYALDRVNMLRNRPARAPKRIEVPTAGGTGTGISQFAMTADLDAPPPPAGSPAFVMRHRDDEVRIPPRAIRPMTSWTSTRSRWTSTTRTAPTTPP